MGVTRTDYVVYGYRLTKEQVEKHNIKWHEPQLDPYICGAPAAGDYRLVVDQMCSEYMIFGMVAHDSDKQKCTIFRPASYNGFVAGVVLEKFVELFGQEVCDDCITGEPTFIAFTHYN